MTRSCTSRRHPSRPFLALTNQLLPRRGFGDLRDQLERASASIVLNTAVFVIARSSALECAAIVDVLHVRSLAGPALCDQAAPSWFA